MAEQIVAIFITMFMEGLPKSPKKPMMPQERLTHSHGSVRFVSPGASN
ncbi:MAG: hypothetical protein ABWY02_10220 [Telluria sp.]